MRNRILVAAWALVALAGCRRAEAPKQTAGYAEPKACGQCHGPIAATYQKTGMGRSMGWAGGENVPATVTDPAGGASYAVANREGALVVERGASQERAESAIGSGDHARSYLRRDAAGVYAALPVTWYAAGGSWVGSQGHFVRGTGAECLACHAAQHERVQPIDCQACHGPGAAHAYSGGRKAIVNPEKLSRERQLEVCEQCHLRTPSGGTLARSWPGKNAYRPGEPLGDAVPQFTQAAAKGGGAGPVELAGAAYRLRQSACFQKSQMTCGTCHEAHAVQNAAQLARCQQCHARPHHPETTCVECHMPKRPAADAPGLAVTDHFIQRPEKQSRPASAGRP